MMRRIAIFSASLCFMTAIHAADEARTDWQARYRVVFGETQAGVPTAEVEARPKCMAKAEACPKSVEVDMAEDEFPKGYGGLLVHESKSEQIRSGDVIVGVAGSPISTFEDLRRSFRDRKPASQVAISVIREGKKIDLDVVLGGKQGDTVPQSRSGLVALDVIPEADPMVLEIRRSLFGTMLKDGRS